MHYGCDLHPSGRKLVFASQMLDCRLKQFLTSLDLIGATPRTFLDKLRVGISLVDARTSIILFANKEFARILDYPSECLMDECVSFLSITHPDDQGRNADLQAKLLRGEIEHYELDKRYLRPDGSIVWANVSVEAIHRSEESTWSVALIKDITARKILKQQLDAVEIVTTIATWNWAVKSDTMEISSSFNDLHGLPAGAPAPSLVEAMKVVHPDDREYLLATISQGIETRTGYTLEYRILPANGDVRWLRTTATCLYDAAGEVSNLVGATIDVTEVRTRRPVRKVSVSLGKVLRHIDENWNKTISLDDVGKRFGISARSIHSYFASEGTTPHKYIKSIRLRHARQKLLTSDRTTTVTAVALQCGFSNLGHFAKDYRKEFGEAPSETIKVMR